MKNVIKVEKIKQFMKDKKLTKKEFCEKCGISCFVLNKILLNKVNFDYIAIFKVASFMNARPSELINYSYVPLY